MKRTIALILIMALCATTALAAEWPEGRSSMQPYAGLPAIELSRTVGYMIFSPLDKPAFLVANHYCGTLRIYFPREDLTLGEGALRVMNAEGLVERVGFDSADFVTLRQMTESELVSLRWGEGVCCEVTLRESLTVGESYYVTMERNCLFVAGSNVGNVAIEDDSRWSFTVQGDYGVSKVNYCVVGDVETTVSPNVTPAPDTGAYVEPEVIEREVKEQGVARLRANAVSFHVELGGEATQAFLYSRDNCVAFPEDSLVLTESGDVLAEFSGEALGEWGVIFKDKDGKDLYYARIYSGPDED